MPTQQLVSPRVVHSPWLDRVEPNNLLTDDGIDLYYETVGNSSPGAPVLMLAHGLGGKLYAWEPLLERFADRYRIVTWDYRGLFRSTSPRRTKDLAIRYHAEDAIRILEQEGIERATFVGWSMGVQVCLETALEFPSQVERMVLLNGTYGQVFQTGLQPFMRLPGVPGTLHRLAERLGRTETRLSRLIRRLALAELHLGPIGRALGFLYRNPCYEDMYRQYMVDVFGSSLTNYLRLFQVLDAHSVYHLLPEVQQKTLVVSGGLDFLTPARMSFKVVRRIPRSEHLHLSRASHFAVLEFPERVFDRMEAFLAS